MYYIENSLLKKLSDWTAVETGTRDIKVILRFHDNTCFYIFQAQGGCNFCTFRDSFCTRLFGVISSVQWSLDYLSARSPNLPESRYRPRINHFFESGSAFVMFCMRCLTFKTVI